jgi:hypothetical protein
VVAGVERIIRRAAEVALVNFITRRLIRSLPEHIPSRLVQQGRVVWGAARLVALQRMVVILSSDPSIVMVVAAEEPLEVWIMEDRGGRVAARHVADPVARPSRLPPVLEMPEEILEAV